MSELSGVESPEVSGECGVCHISARDEEQFLGVCVDPINCVQRYAGVVQRIALIRHGISGVELERRVVNGEPI